MGYRSSTTAVHTVIENANNIQITCKGSSSSTGQTLYAHATAIDLTNYTTLHCKAYIQYANDYVGIAIMSSLNSGAMGGAFPSWPGYVSYVTSSATTETEFTIDVSALNGNYYIYMACGENYSGGNIETNGYFTEVWLT